MERMCTGQEVRGKRDTILLEALEVERLIKTKKNH
jgi:hypothetical protein